MMALSQMSREQLEQEKAQLEERYHAFQSRGLKLDMSRGKPGNDQLDLSNGMLEVLTADDYKAENGLDCRNYGNSDGLPEMRRIFADLLEIDPDEVASATKAAQLADLLRGALTAKRHAITA